MESCLTSISSNSSAPKTTTVSSVYLTLPLACQVCLGKVKDPVVCPNQHVFCSACMAQWLKSSQSRMCPTCRVPITDKQPCKRIIGSMDCSPTVHDKSIKEHMRKARFEILYQEYENEIKGVEQKLEECQTENHHIKEINNDLKTRLESTELRLTKALKTGSPEDANADAVTQDINTILKLSSRLQDMINYNKTLKEENDTFKLEIRDSKRQNEALKEEVDKLVQGNNFNKSPQRFSRYTVAALQTKVDNYEREIVRLRRALERSDDYVDELKRQLQAQNQHQDAAEFPVRGSNDFSGPSELGNIGNETNALSSDISPPHLAATSLEVSRIDELANIALATRHLPFETSIVDNATVQMGSPQYADASPREQSAATQMPAGYSNGSVDTPSGCNAVRDNKKGGRSVFEDSSKFPACAKLIELTKVRRVSGDQTATSAVVSDALTSFPSGNFSESKDATMRRSNLLNILMQPREGMASPIATTMVGREGSAFSVVSNQLARSSESTPNVASPHAAAATDDAPPQQEYTHEDSPLDLLQANFAATPSSSKEKNTDCSPGELAKSYPSSVVLTNNQSPSDVIYAKRIKIEQHD